MSDEAVCRTAPATLCLLILSYFFPQPNYKFVYYHCTFSLRLLGILNNGIYLKWLLRKIPKNTVKIYYIQKSGDKEDKVKNKVRGNKVWNKYGTEKCRRYWTWDIEWSSMCRIFMYQNYISMLHWFIIIQCVTSPFFLFSVLFCINGELMICWRVTWDSGSAEVEIRKRSILLRRWE